MIAVNEIDLFNDLEDIRLALTMCLDDIEWDLEDPPNKKAAKHWKRRRALVKMAVKRVDKWEHRTLKDNEWMGDPAAEDGPEA